MGLLSVKVLKVLLAATIGFAILAQSAAATALPNSNTFEQANGPDGTCELHLNVGGPYEVSIAGGPPTIYENGSVVSVPQGSAVNYLRVERTIGFTAIGTNERCAVFTAEIGSDDAGADVTGSDEEPSITETSEEAAPLAEQPAELAATGSEALLVALVGVVLVASGLVVVGFGRRRFA